MGNIVVQCRLDLDLIEQYQSKVKQLVRRLQPVHIPGFIKAEPISVTFNSQKILDSDSVRLADTKATATQPVDRCFVFVLILYQIIAMLVLN